MEGTLDNRSIRQQRPVAVPTRDRVLFVGPIDYSNAPAQAVINAQEKTTASEQRFSRLTPIYQKTVAVQPIVSPGRVLEGVRQASDSHSARAINKVEHERSPRIDRSLLVTSASGATQTHAIGSAHHAAVKSQFQRSITKHSKRIQRRQKLWIVRRAATFAFFTAVVLIGGYAIYDSLVTNQQAKQAIAKDAPSIAVVNSPVQATTPAPATSAPAFTVAPNAPKYITISKLGIRAQVVTVGLTSSGAVGVPSNTYQAAWYNGSAAPGGTGATLIDGHSSADHGAVFGNLYKLASGDIISVERGDGAVFNYKVVYTQIVSKDAVDMASMMQPYGNAKNGLNLITCEGDWINSEKTLTNRDLVYTVQI